MAEDRLQDVLRPAALAQQPHAPGRMVLRWGVGGVRIALVIEIVNESGETPAFRIFAEMLRVGAHGGFDGEHVLSERLAGRELVHEGERISSRWESRHESQYTACEADARHCPTTGPTRRIRPMTHLRSIALRGIPPDAADRFPFSVPIVRHLEPLELATAVTFLVGENGSGKSTLLEGIAAAAGLPTV